MKINEIYIKEGLFERSVKFTNNVNLIFSEDNSCGKTTLVRMILYSLGYQIPNTKNIKFEKCDVRCELSLDDERVIHLHRYNSFAITVEETETSFALPEQQDELHQLLLGTNNKDILHNILGAFYLDQEKGWTLLNRGTVIGSIHFNIDELIRGISGVDCSELISREKRIDADLEKYKQMFSIAQYQESVQQSGLVTASYQEKVDIELEQLILKKNSIEKEIRRVGQTICGNRKFMEFVDDMKLLVRTSDGQQITVTKDNIVGLNDSVKLLIAKKKILMRELSDVLGQIDKKSAEQKKEDNQLSFFESESMSEMFDKKIAAIPMNQIAIKNEIDRLTRARKELKDDISRISRSNNGIVKSLYENIVNYVKELGVGDSASVTEKYLFTTNLKELSGAVLHKTVFAFKLGYIKELEKNLGICLPIILDSPKGKEVDDKNITAMMKILKRDFPNNQIIIASIYEYDFDQVNKIELSGRLINSVISTK